jgi:hypothetical protein
MHRPKGVSERDGVVTQVVLNQAEDVKKDEGNTLELALHQWLFIESTNTSRLSSRRLGITIHIGNSSLGKYVPQLFHDERVDLREFDSR